MDINSLYTCIYRAPSTPRFTPDEIQNKFTEWFRNQQFKPIALTSDQRSKLREQLDKVCSKREKIDSLVNYASKRMLFPSSPLALDPLLVILEKDKPTLPDYKYLAGAVKALFNAYQNYFYRVRNEEVFSFYTLLWKNNYFVPPGLPLNGEYVVRVNETSRQALKPESLILAMSLMEYISVNHDAFLSMKERTAVPDQVLFKLIYDSKKYQDPELDIIVKGFFGLHQLACCEDVMNTIKPEENQLILPEMLYREFIAQLFPKVIGNMESEKSHFYSEIASQIRELRGTLENVYAIVLAKMKKMKDEFPHKTHPNFHVLYPEPFKTLDEFRTLLDSIINFRLKLESEERWKRIKIEVDAQIAFESNPKGFPKVMSSATRPSSISTEAGLITWFDDRYEPSLVDTKFASIPQSKKDKIRFDHNLARIIDDIALMYGKQFVKINENGDEQHMIWMAVQAETSFSKNAEFYSLTMTFNSDGTLFHRALTEKSQAMLVDEMVALDDSKKELKIEIAPDLLKKVAVDGSYILKVEGNVITVADPKLRLENGSPTLIHLMVI